MIEFNCKVCGGESGSFAALHRHLKKEHGMSPSDYYPLFFDRRDLFDGELIEFKDVKSYFATDFNSKYNFLKWVAVGDEEVKDYCLNILVKRAAEKGTNVIPGHVELKSFFAPSLSDYLTIFGGVKNFEAALAWKGLKMKVGVGSVPQKEGDFKIFVDTREKLPLPFENCEVKKLIVGDYCPSEEFFCNVFLERKSMFDLAGTLTSGFERFEREIQRAAQLGAYLVVVVESSFVDALDYSPKNSFSQRIGGAYLFNKVRKLVTENNNVQFVFAKNRARSMQIIERVFRMGEAAKGLDLEFAKDRGEI